MLYFCILTCACSLLYLLKMLHSEAGITDSFEDPIMSSYPMKVALIHQVEAGREQGTFKYTPNEKNTEYSRTCSDILDRVDKEGGGLNSYYIDNDAIFKPGQRSYLEARRIALYIRSLQQDYAIHGIINTLLVSVIFFANLLILLTITDVFTIDVLPYQDNDPAHVAMIMRPMSIISFILCIVGFLLAFGFLACSCYDSDFGGSKPGPTIVYGLHKWVMGYYSAFGLIQLIPLVFYSFLTYCDAYYFDPEKHSDRKARCSGERTDNALFVLLWVSLGIAALICIVILIHFIFIMIKTKGRPNNHILGLVFHGCCICREKYPCCTQCSSCTKPQTNDSQHSDSIASENVIVGGRVSDNQESELLVP